MPYALVDGLCRVDIMQRSNGRLVVNEFESLEATYGSNGSPNTEHALDVKLVAYYASILNDLL